jgi:plastocyanin
MKKVIMLIVILISLLVIAGCSSAVDKKGNDVDTVQIKDSAFNPATLTVDAGTTVVFINVDKEAHKLKSTTFNSNNMKKGDSYSHTFTEQGSYDYICDIHPEMTGKIVVE